MRWSRWGYRLAGVLVLYVVAQVWYWTMPPELWGQPDPQIVAMEPPVVNRNIDAAGVRAVPEGARLAGVPPEWIPVPATDFRPGELMYTLRHDCFFNKLSSDIVREFVCDLQPTAPYQLPTSPPPKTTPSGRCSRANFATPIPKDIEPGQWCTYVVRARFFKNKLVGSMERHFTPVRIRIVE